MECEHYERAVRTADLGQCHARGASQHSSEDSMMRMRRSGFICVSLSLVLSISAQQAPPPQPPETVKFQTSTQLVVQMVSVKDKSGKIIEGLTAKDFAITEDGKPQTIQFCEFQRLDDTPLSVPVAAPPVAPTPAVASVTRNQIMPEKPGDIRYRDRRLIAIYFDMTAMPPMDQLRAIYAAQKFVRK